MPRRRHAHRRARRLLGARARLRREAGAPREQGRARRGEGRRRQAAALHPRAPPRARRSREVHGRPGLGPKDVFTDGLPVDVEGWSKGKGYQGVIKRHHMEGMRSAHGTHEYFRHGGSIGCRLTPQRVHKGKRMAGQMGNEKVTVQNLQLFRILAEENVILVRGSIPGAKNEYVVVTKAATRTAYKRKGMGKEEVRSKNPLKASKKAAAGRGAQHHDAAGRLPGASATGRCRFMSRKGLDDRSTPPRPLSPEGEEGRVPRARGLQARGARSAVQAVQAGPARARPRLRAGLVAAVRARARSASAACSSGSIARRCAATSRARGSSSATS